MVGINLDNTNIENPKIMERPIAELGSNAIICRPSEKILDLLTNEDKNENI